ncbi:MAG: threonylcarbamoyl-AMP synthase [Hyphomicrobiaceae bacterium]|nr:threonylcarbamoyl-AMP synthase [Hyphomicrobiaceae bacterium]
MLVTRPTGRTIEEAGASIRAGQLVAFPTETVYGLGADSTNARAVAEIFAAKGRPAFNPLIVHVASLEQAATLAELTTTAQSLGAAFWPGPLTLVARRRAGSPIADLVTAGLDTVALRVPAHTIALALLRAAGVPIAAPSANRSGHVSPTRAEHVAADLGDRVSMILDGGACEHGLESTVLDVTGDGGGVRLLRLGAVTAEAIEALIGAKLVRATGVGHSASGDGLPVSPGQLLNHYAPRARVRLNVESPVPGEALLAFGSPVPAHDGAMLNLSPAADLVEAAANLYSGLRALDDTGATSIAVMPIPHIGLGEAINDRLARAAVGRLPERS